MNELISLSFLKQIYLIKNLTINIKSSIQVFEHKVTQVPDIYLILQLRFNARIQKSIKENIDSTQQSNHTLPIFNSLPTLLCHIKYWLFIKRDDRSLRTFTKSSGNLCIGMRLIYAYLLDRGVAY